MKLSTLLGVAILGLMAAAMPSHAQISDNESSAAVLASFCARSSGAPASNYESYARELASTISQLPVVAQKRVFEDKMPIVPADSGTTSGEQNGAINASDQARSNASGDSAVVQAANDAANTPGNGSSGSDWQTQNSNNSGNKGKGKSNAGGNSSNGKGWGQLLDFVNALNEYLFGSGGRRGD